MTLSASVQNDHPVSLLASSLPLFAQNGAIRGHHSQLPGPGGRRRQGRCRPEDHGADGKPPGMRKTQRTSVSWTVNPG